MTVERIDAELSSDPKPGEMTRKLRQLSTKIHHQQDSLEEELQKIRVAKHTVTEAFQERIRWAEEKLQHLATEALPFLEADLESKTEAWKIDLLCLRVSPSNVCSNDVDLEQAGPLGKRPKAADVRSPMAY